MCRSEQVSPARGGWLFQRAAGEPRRTALAAGVLVAAFGLAGMLEAQEPQAPDRHAEVSDVSYQLICQCGCDMVLSECNHQNCPFAVPERAVIAERLSQGETPEAIIASYVEGYGRVILAQPTMRGFDAVAWLAPILALVTGGIVVVMVVRTWSRRHEVRPEARGATSTASVEGPVAQSLIERVQRELGGEP